MAEATWASYNKSQMMKRKSVDDLNAYKSQSIHAREMLQVVAKRPIFAPRRYHANAL